MRHPAPACLALALAAACCAAAWSQTSAPAATQTQPSEKVKKRLVAVVQILASDATDDTLAAVDKLSTIQDAVQIQAKTFRQATDDFRTAVGVNLVVNWPDLKAAGVTQDTPVSLSLKEVSSHQALRSLLDVAAGVSTTPAHGEPTGLDYLVSDGVVEIHSRAWMDRQRFPRVYDPVGLTGKGFYPAAEDPAAVKDRGQRLTEVCRRLITPDLWGKGADAAGRGGNVCKFLADQLAVVGPLRSHFELSVLFDDLHHPIHLPVTKAEAAANQRRTAEPVELPPRLRPTESYLHTLKRLQEPFDLHADGAPDAATLAKVLGVIQETGSINLVPDWQGGAAANLLPNAPVRYATPTPAPTLQKTLDEVLLAAGAKSPQISTSPEGVITIAATAETDQRIAAYDARDLIRRWIYNFNNTGNPKEKLTEHQVMDAIIAGLQKAGFTVLANGGVPQGGMPGGAGGGEGSVNGEAGGKSAPTAHIMEFEGILIVRGTAEEQRAIARQLAILAR